MTEHYNDTQAAADLKKEMERYAKNPESFVYVGLDYLSWLMNKKGAHGVAEEISRHKAKYLEVKKIDHDGYDVTDRVESTKALHRCINGVMGILGAEEYNGVATILDNWRAKYLGEPEDHLDI